MNERKIYFKKRAKQKYTKDGEKVKARKSDEGGFWTIFSFKIYVFSSWTKINKG